MTRLDYRLVLTRQLSTRPSPGTCADSHLVHLSGRSPATAAPIPRRRRPPLRQAPSSPLGYHHNWPWRPAHSRPHTSWYTGHELLRRRGSSERWRLWRTGAGDWTADLDAVGCRRRRWCNRRPRRLASSATGIDCGRVLPACAAAGWRRCVNPRGGPSIGGRGALKRCRRRESAANRCGELTAALCLWGICVCCSRRKCAVPCLAPMTRSLLIY